MRPERPDADALACAMAVVPALYSRNKMFDFFSDPAVPRARRRAVSLRSVVRQLSREEPAELALVESGERFVLRYRIAHMRFSRRLDLSKVEAACVAYLLARAGRPLLGAAERERAVVEAALRRLADGLQLQAIEAGTFAPER